MKYIKNNTDNNVVIRNFVNNKEVILSFSKSSVTALDSTVESAFKESCAQYETLFTNGTLSYTVRPEERYADDFSYYFKSYKIANPATTGTIELTFDKALAGEELYMLYAKDGDETTSVGFELDETGIYTTNLGKIDNYVEFRITSNHATDFPMSFSNRIKAYI